MHTLLGISFLIHLLTILAVVVLYQRRSLQRASLPSMKEDVETLHESMEAFINEVEKENELLYERMVEYFAEKEKHLHQDIENLASQIKTMNNKDMKKDTETNTASDPYIETDIEKDMDIEQSTVQSLEEINLTHLKQEKVQNEANEPQEKVSTESAESTEAKFKQAKELYLQGFNVEHIAKVLQIGKGETALIVNMMEKSKERQRND